MGRTEDTAAAGGSPRPTTREGWLDWAERTGRIAMSATVREAWRQAFDRDPACASREIEALEEPKRAGSLARALGATGLNTTRGGAA